MLELARKAGDVNLQAAAEKNHTLRKRTQGRCRVEVYPSLFPLRVIEFFLTDWMQGNANQFACLFHRLSPGPDPPLPHAAS